MGKKRNSARGAAGPRWAILDKHDKHDIVNPMAVRMTAEAIADYQRLPLTVRARVARVVERLEMWPDVSGTKPLRGNWKAHFRLRTGDWRVIVKPKGDVIWVVRIDNRRDVYGD